MARGRARVRPRASRGDRSISSVLVTGASTGIGEATAVRLRDAGRTVFASVRQAGDPPEGTTELVFDVPGSIATPIWSKPQRTVEESPPEAARVIEHALTSPKPKTRYVVGPDAKRRARLQKLPDRLRDRMLARFLFGS